MRTICSSLESPKESPLVFSASILPSVYRIAVWQVSSTPAWAARRDAWALQFKPVREVSSTEGDYSAKFMRAKFVIASQS